MINILIYVNHEKMCLVNKVSPELNREFVKEEINAPLSSSSRAIERQKKY